MPFIVTQIHYRLQNTAQRKVYIASRENAQKDMVVDLCSDSTLPHNERGFTHRMRACKPIYLLNSSRM